MNLISSSHLVNLPRESDLCIFLIREELKSWKFFNYLRQTDLDGSMYQMDLSEAILSLVGITDPADEVYDFYYDLIEKHSTEMKPGSMDITRRAMMVWGELVGRG
ncbi:hypothetical protein WSM22_26240 [Cytophagales bacterium WSM2-2]|nr:hypothetical protein WSM22_26240 [Cytophagales bacterium WSM2-2]